jgi:hypothetical protein
LYQPCFFYFCTPADTGDKKIEPFQVATSYGYVGKTYKTIEDFIQLGRFVVLGGGIALYVIRFLVAKPFAIEALIFTVLRKEVTLESKRIGI